MSFLASTDHSALVILTCTALLCVIGGLLPFSPMEPMIVAIALAVRPALVLPVILVATITQMAAKMLVYAGGGSARGALRGRRQAMVDAARERLSGRRSLRLATTFVSAVVGLPPFYAVTIAYGALRLPLREYLITGTCGRTLRMTALVLAGRLLVATPAFAEQSVGTPVPPAVTVQGAGRRP